MLIILISFYYVGYSQTEVSGNISSDTKWTKANSPYLILDDLTIFGGVTLEIESGVTVNSNSGKRFLFMGVYYALEQPMIQYISIPAE